MLLAVDFFTDTPLEIIVVTPANRENAGQPFLQALNKRFIPNRILTVIDEKSVGAVARLIPLAGEKSAMNGKATAYVCRKGTCDLPTTDPEELGRQVDR
jgi:hypothetical protein